MKKLKLDPDSLTVVTFDAVSSDLLSQAQSNVTTGGPWFCNYDCTTVGETRTCYC